MTEALTAAERGDVAYSITLEDSAEEFHSDVSARRSREPRRLARNVGALASGQAVTWTMTLVWTLIVPRALGPVGLGLVVSALSVSGVLGIVLGLGTRNYVMREIVVRPQAGPKLVGTAIVMRIVLAPIVACGAVAFAQLAGYGHERAVVLYLAAAMTVLTLLAEPMQAAFQALERMQYLAYADIFNKSAQSLIGIALVLVGFKAVGVVANMAIIAGVMSLLLALWLRRFMHIDLRTNFRMITKVARESLAYWAFGVFGMVYLWIDTIMLSLMTSAQEVGWYGAPTRLFQTLMFLPVLLSTAWLPRLVAAHEEGGGHLLGTARKPLELVLVLSVPIAAGMAMAAGPLVDVVYGSAFSEAVPATVILAICIPPMYLNIMLSSVLLAAKRQVVWTWVMAAAAVANPIFNLVLIPATQRHYGNGAIGAALSLLLTEIVMVVFGFMMVGRHVFDRNAVKRCLLATLASGAMWGAAYAARPMGAAASLAAGIATFTVLVLALRIATPEEVAALQAGLGRLRKRLPANRGSATHAS
jgi:O-antigen/teichoic acid export membrane protein